MHVIEDSGARWTIAIAHIVASSLAACLTVPSVSHPHAEAALCGLLYVLFVAGIASAFALSALKVFAPDVTCRACNAYAANAVWFAPLAVCITQHRPWTPLAAAVLGAATARLVRPSAAAVEIRIPAPMFGVLVDPVPSAKLLPSFAAGLMFQVGVIAHAAGQAATASILIGAAALVAFSFSESRATHQPNFSNHALLAIIVTAASIAHIPGAPSDWVRQDEAGGSTRAASDEDLFSGAVLLSDRARFVKLAAPPKGTTKPTLKIIAKPAEIEFSGEYWILPWSLLRPPGSAMVVRSSPVDYKFSAVDRSRLRMQARQRLGVSIDTACCSSLEVHFHSAEDQAATITIGAVLVNSTLRMHPGFSLGIQDLPASEAGTLIFPMPDKPLYFDQIVIDYHLHRARAHRSARVSIDRLVLVPDAR